MKKMIASLLLALPLTACGGMNSASYLVSVHDRASGTAIEGATVEVRPSTNGVAEPGARGLTDSRGETVLLLTGRERADLFVTFDGDTERYWFATSRVPGYDAPRDEIDGEQSPLKFITGPTSNGTPAWRVSVVRVLERVR